MAYNELDKISELEAKKSEEWEDKGLRQAREKYNKASFSSLIKQVQAEYALAWLHQNGRIQANLGRLKLYNNQKKDQNLVGDPLLFTVHQTLLASFYKDQLSVSFEGKEEGDSDTADNLDALALYDNDLMMKDVLDYSWIFDSSFFGRGLTILREFDRSEEFMCPIPEMVDPMTWLYDPNATSVNGDVHRVGAMRFGGREISMTRWQMEDNGNYINLDELKEGGSIKSLLEQASKERFAAAGLEQMFGDVAKVPMKLYGNAEYNLLEWFTHWRGKKCLVTLGNNMKLITRYKELGDSSDRWRIIDRPIYPLSHTWEGVSVPDLVEDKQRQRSVAINLGLNIMKSDLYPSYIYDEKAVKNPQDLEKFNRFNHFIPVKSNYKDVRSAVQPLNKATPNGQMLDYILNTLDAAAQRATATPEMQQGKLSEERRTLGELNLVASRVDTRYSLAVKIFGWSERAYWRNWYELYKKHFKDVIDEKVIRLNSAFGSKWRPLTRENIIASRDPDIIIESADLAEEKNFRERALLTAYGQYVLADPTANVRYFKKKLAKAQGMRKDEIERLFPPTSEELRAEEENTLINEDKVPPINAMDDHKAHWEIHSKAAETPAKEKHMRAHLEGMTMQRQQPEIFPEQTLPPELRPREEGEETEQQQNQRNLLSAVSSAANQQANQTRSAYVG